MGFLCNFALNAFSICVLLVIRVYSKNQSGVFFFQNRLFHSILYSCAALLFFDSFSRIDGYPDTFLPVVNALSNLLLFLFSLAPPSLWLLFVFNHIHAPQKQNKRLIFLLVLLNLFHTVLIVLSQFNGIIYTISPDNVYARGPLYPLSAAFSIVLLLYASSIVLVNRRKIERRHFYALLFFTFPPFVCLVFQIFFYGLSLSLNGVAMSILIVFLYIQNQWVNLDYLTGVYNRKMLETYLKKRIMTSTEGKAFGAIMIDINDFKCINDTYGHSAGDQALQKTAQLLKSCLNRNDFVARYGGDEFCVVLDLPEPDFLRKTAEYITRCFEQYNEVSEVPYKLSLSMGYAVYDHRSHRSADGFEKEIDQRMYRDKQLYKSKEKGFCPSRGAPSPVDPADLVGQRPLVQTAEIPGADIPVPVNKNSDRNG